MLILALLLPVSGICLDTDGNYYAQGLGAESCVALWKRGKIGMIQDMLAGLLDSSQQ